MRFDVLTLFPESFQSFLDFSMIKRAIDKGVVSIGVHGLRDWTDDRHRTCDDKPFGGGPGMLLKPEPVFAAHEELFGKKKRLKGRPFIYLSPQGKPFTQKRARSLAKCRQIVLLCGHYEGVDQRVIDALVTEELSIGDYVLTGGEIPAMVVMDAVIRLVPGVLGRAESKEIETFQGNLLEYPQYTRPSDYRGLKVPSVLLSGNHRKIQEWREKEAHKRTLKKRPDLLKGKKV